MSTIVMEQIKQQPFDHLDIDYLLSLYASYGVFEGEGEMISMSLPIISNFPSKCISNLGMLNRINDNIPLLTLSQFTEEVPVS